MTFDEISGDANSHEDQADQDYIRDADGFAIHCGGHYTERELLAKLAALREANQYFSK